MIMQKSTSFDFNQSYFNAGKGAQFFELKTSGKLAPKGQCMVGV